MKKNIVIIAATMAFALGISGVAYASNANAGKENSGKADKQVVEKQNDKIAASYKSEAGVEVENEEETVKTVKSEPEKSSENAAYVLELVNQMQLDKAEAKDEAAGLKDAVLEKKKALIETQKSGTEEEINDAKTALEDAIKEYTEAKSGMKTSVGKLKKADSGTTGKDKSNNGNSKGHQAADE